MSPHEIPQDLVATLVAHGAEGRGEISNGLAVSHTDDMFGRGDESVFRPGFGGVREKSLVIGDYSRSGGHRAAHDNRVFRHEMAKHGFSQFRRSRQNSIYNDLAQPLVPGE